MTLDRCPWYIAGPLLGVVIVGLRALLNQPLGALVAAVGCRLLRGLGVRSLVTNESVEWASGRLRSWFVRKVRRW